MAKRRFEAPAREAVDPAVFEHPAFAPYRFELDLLTVERWPDVGTLNARACGLKHASTGRSLRFVEQTPELLAEGLHYETRIFERGEIPTRADNWHDLLNALVWMRFPQLKSALNARQAIDVATVGASERTRGQCALTHFDEAGVLVRVSDAHTLALWDAHDWGALGARVQLDPDAIEAQVFGHALLEHALYPQPLLVGKPGHCHRRAAERPAGAAPAAHGALARLASAKRRGGVPARGRMLPAAARGQGVSICRAAGCRDLSTTLLGKL